MRTPGREPEGPLGGARIARPRARGRSASRRAGAGLARSHTGWVICDGLRRGVTCTGVRRPGGHELASEKQIGDHAADERHDQPDRPYRNTAPAAAFALAP
jgi:hypothetical protein